MPKKNYVKYLILIAVIFLTTVGLTYAYFTASVQGEGTEQVMISGDVVLSFQDSVSTVLNDVTPGDSVTKTFHVKNNTNKIAYYDIGWETLSNGFINNEIHIELKCTQYANYGTASQSISGECYGLKDTAVLTIEDYIVSNVFIGPNLTQEYEAKLTFIETDEDQSYNIGKTFRGVLDVEGSTDSSTKWYSNCAGSNKLNCKIITATSPQSDAYVVFEVAPTTGLFYTYDLSMTSDITNDGIGERVYYYRGAPTNNYVSYGGFCWRILRTNEDGTVRMRFSGAMNGSSCSTVNGINVTNYGYNDATADNTYVGYMYGTVAASTFADTHSNTYDSAIKEAIDKWYDVYLKAYSALIADEVFCNDRSVSQTNAFASLTNTKNGFGTSLTFYGLSDRSIIAGTSSMAVKIKTNPSLRCERFSDRFTISEAIGNGKLTYPIALATADEAIFAGAYYGSTATTTFASATTSFTMTPLYYDGASYMAITTTAGGLTKSTATTATNVYPVISVIDSAIVSSGEGTSASPYVIQ